MQSKGAFPEDRELVLTRLIDAPRANVFKAWTDPEIFKQWFAPKPFSIPVAELDVRPGGANFIVMTGPDGSEIFNSGVYLEIIPNERLVFTDAFTRACEPKEGAPFMVVIVTLEDECGKTRYTARIRHWTVDARKQHEEMGFYNGWGTCADQLEAVAKSL
jgi:uncharacterized protein YndB with AHSA1/START domain